MHEDVAVPEAVLDADAMPEAVPDAVPDAVLDAVLAEGAIVVARAVAAGVAVAEAVLPASPRTMGALLPGTPLEHALTSRAPRPAAAAIRASEPAHSTVTLGLRMSGSTLTA